MRIKRASSQLGFADYFGGRLLLCLSVIAILAGLALPIMSRYRVHKTKKEVTARVNADPSEILGFQSKGWEFGTNKNKVLQRFYVTKLPKELR